MPLRGRAPSVTNLRSLSSSRTLLANIVEAPHNVAHRNGEQAADAKQRPERYGLSGFDLLPKRTEYPSVIMSSWLYPARSRNALMRAPNPMKNAVGYAISREFATRGDGGGNHFNTSELAGNAVAAGISNLYYPAVNRSFGNTANKWGQQIALDTFFNVAKEFWPDARNKMFRH